MIHPTDTWNEDTHAGPPSEEISIPDFVAKAHGLGIGGGLPSTIQTEWNALARDTKLALESECECVIPSAVGAVAQVDSV